MDDKNLNGKSIGVLYIVVFLIIILLIYAGKDAFDSVYESIESRNEYYEEMEEMINE